MFDNTLHLPGGKAPDSRMISQLAQFRFQYAMIIDPPPKLQNRCPTAQMRVVKHCQLTYPISPYRKGRLFHI